MAVSKLQQNAVIMSLISRIELSRWYWKLLRSSASTSVWLVGQDNGHGSSFHNQTQPELPEVGPNPSDCQL